MKHSCHYNTPIGMILIEEEDGYITALYTCEGTFGVEDEETELIKRTYDELCEYFAGQRREFDIPQKPNGTRFQQRVWEALRRIPYGQTRSYGEIAAQIGNPKAARAVGGANNRNPILILTPCHRVIGADGSLVGFGAGIDIKEKLIELEGKTR